MNFSSAITNLFHIHKLFYSKVIIFGGNYSCAACIISYCTYLLAPTCSFPRLVYRVDLYTQTVIYSNCFILCCHLLKRRMNLNVIYYS